MRIGIKQTSLYTNQMRGESGDGQLAYAEFQMLLIERIALLPDFGRRFQNRVYIRYGLRGMDRAVNVALWYFIFVRYGFKWIGYGRPFSMFPPTHKQSL